MERKQFGCAAAAAGLDLNFRPSSLGGEIRVKNTAEGLWLGKSCPITGFVPCFRVGLLERHSIFKKLTRCLVYEALANKVHFRIVSKRLKMTYSFN